MGSPRTGSTFLYQLVVNFFNVFYFSNLINDKFWEFPVCGAALSSMLNCKEVSYKSDFGKTQTLCEPSEASLIMKKWFGGEHPSQTQSKEIKENKKSHILNTLSSISAITQQPILIKNAWNCFRIKNWCDMFPQSRFIWIRRDINRSAQSDLLARIHRGSPNIWNSATTYNYKEIQTKPAWEQVVLQQYEYNKAIAESLENVKDGHVLEVWYEDLCEDCGESIKNLSEFLQEIPRQREEPIVLINKKVKEDKNITNFIDQNHKQFQKYRRK